jgi:3-oxoacyl-[acyl-carrier protein] reductase
MTHTNERVVLVTGGYGNLGQCFAKTFRDAGDRVIITGRDSKRLEKVATELGCDAHYALDVMDRDQVAAVANMVKTSFGRIDVLINNAGLMGAGGSLETVDADAFSAVVNTNICGTMNCCQAFLPLLEQAEAALVVNVASTSGHRADAHSAAYNVSKFGLIGFSEALRKDWRAKGIRVSTLSPSSIAFNEQPQSGKGARLHGDDVAQAALDLANLPARALVRDIELWATNP